MSDLAASEQAGSRCTGHCCKRFDLPFSPDDLRDSAEWVLTAPPRGPRDPRLTDDPCVVQVASMVEHLGVEHDWRGFRHYYTCRNLLPDGNCGIYETRPDMCRDYPYGRPCKFEGCTYEPPPVPTIGPICDKQLVTNEEEG